MMGMNWDRVISAIEQAAKEKQDDANRAAVLGESPKAELRDETASILRTLAGALRFGLEG